jgi:hypothetical protein
MGVGSLSETHGVDLIMKASGGRAVPDAHHTLITPERGHCGRSPARRRPRPVSRWSVEMVGWAALPDPVVARATVLRGGGTPVPDETTPAGCLRNHPVVPRGSRRVTTGQSPRDHPTCSDAAPGGKTSISQRHHTTGGSPTGPGQTAAPARPHAFGWRIPPVPDRTGRGESPRDQREGPPKPRQPHQLAPRRAATDESEPEHSVRSRRSTGASDRAVRPTRPATR